MSTTGWRHGDGGRPPVDSIKIKTMSTTIQAQSYIITYLRAQAHTARRLFKLLGACMQHGSYEKRQPAFTCSRSLKVGTLLFFKPESKQEGAPADHHSSFVHVATFSESTVVLATASFVVPAKASFAVPAPVCFSFIRQADDSREARPVARSCRSHAAQSPRAAPLGRGGMPNRARHLDPESM